MGNREENLGRKILFTAEDFEPFFAAEGIDFLSLNEAEWRQFENMFMEGISWTEVVDAAVWTIKMDRDRTN